MIKSYSGKRTESKRWIKHALDIHYEKLRNMRPTLEISRPQQFTHLNSRAKQEQQKEERFTEIERANRILLEKMSGILNTKSSLSVPFKKKSLNTEVRKRFLDKIADDNKSFLKRLQCRTPVYNINQWEKEWKQTEKRLKNMSEFTYKSAPRTRVRFRQTKSSSSRNVLFKKSLNISGRYFLVEILKKRDNIRIILYDPQISESYSLEIPYTEALELMDGSENFEYLVGLFRIKNDEIMIVSEKENEDN